MRHRLTEFLWALAVILVFSACDNGEIAVREELSTPEKTYRLWLETADKGNIPLNMKCITEESKRIMDMQLRQMDVFMNRLNANMAIFRSYTVAEQKIKEDRAVIFLKGSKGEKIGIPLFKEPDGWKVDLVALFGGKK